MKSLILPLSALFALSAPAAAQGIPESFFVIHCDPQNASVGNFDALGDMVADAEARNVKLSIEFGVDWVQMILEPNHQWMEDQVRVWEASGHAIGAHHHGVDHPYWDGYTDLPPWEVNRMEPYLGTMADWKEAVDPLFGSDGVPFAAVQDSHREWPYGILYQTDGGRDIENAVSTPEWRVRNKYGAWHIDHCFMDTPLVLLDLKARHNITSPNEVFGVVTHVIDYTALPWIFQDWFDFLQSKDPFGARNKTVMEIIGHLPPPLIADQDMLIAVNGGQVNMTLTTDDSLANQSYMFLMTLSGIDPGYDHNGIYDDGVHIGLNPDTWTDFSMSHANSAHLPGFAGTTDASGAATATVDTLGPLPPSFLGATASFVALIHDGSDVLFSSNPVSVAIL